MSSRLHAVCLAGLFVGCAALLGVGCSDDSSKKLIPGSNEGGEAGEAAGGGAPAGGRGVSAGSGGMINPGEGGAGPGASEAGQGGAPVVGAAGATAAGAPPTTTTITSSAGAGGEPDLGGAGAGSLACGDPGSVNNLLIPAQARQTVCRGTYQVFAFSADATASTFACCSALAPISGIGNGDGGGQFVFTIPDDAPFGDQSISATCSEGPVTGTMDINVSETAVAPEVDGLEESSIFQGDPLQIDGLNLDQVSHVTVVSVDDPAFSTDCQIDPEQLTSFTLVCNLGSLSPGDYSVVVQEDDCGFVVNSPIVTIKQNL